MILGKEKEGLKISMQNSFFITAGHHTDFHPFIIFAHWLVCANIYFYHNRGGGADDSQYAV